MFFKNKAVKTIGLDIGSHYVKACELVKSQDKYELSAFAIEHLLDNSYESKLTAIKKVLKSGHFSVNRVNISVCGPSVIVRYILLPQMTKTQLKGAIKYEAEKFIPFNIDEVVLNAPILEEKREDDKIRVLLVAAKKPFIEGYLKLAKEVGLMPQLVDVDSFALINSFLINYPGEKSSGVIALLNIGESYTSINILKDGISHFMRDVSLGGKDLTKAVAEKLNIHLAEAEEVKCNPGQRQEEIFSIVTPAIHNLLGEISLSFSYYEDQLERGIDKVYLSGGTSKLKGLDKFLGNNLGVEVVPWDPTASIDIKQDLDQQRLKSCLPMLAVSVGLALSSPELS